MPPDFTGKWLNFEIPSGCDTPRFMQEGMEMNFLMRNMARMANYGVGKMMHEVTQNADGSVVTNRMNMPEDKTFTWQVDGVEHPDDGDGNPYLATWEGNVLVITPGTGAKSTNFVLKRYMEGEFMCTHMSYPRKPGVAMERKFQKES